MSAPNTVAWRVETTRTPQAKVWTVVSGDAAIARVHEGAPKRAEANARLIAAAPDLLEALIELHEASTLMPGSRVETDAFAKAAAAIAKATGADQ